MSVCEALLASVLVAPALAAQDVLVVDKNHGAGWEFTTIQSAVNAAQDGDVVLVRTGTYYDESLEIVGKGLTVIADAGADVRLTEGVTVRDTSAAQTTVLRGLRLEPDDWPLNDDKYGLQALSCAGSLRVEACTLFASHIATLKPPHSQSFDGAIVSACASVVFVDCDVSGSKAKHESASPDGGRGLVAHFSRVAAFGCSFRGAAADSVDPEGLGGDGADLHESSLYAAGCSFTGGPGSVYPLGGNGVAAHSSEVTLLEAGLYVDGGLPVLLDLSTLLELPGLRHRVSLTSPVGAGETLQLSAAGQAGELASLLVSLGVHHQFVPVYEAPLLVSLSPALMVPVGTVQPDGTLGGSFLVPPLPASLEALRLHVQALFSGPGEISLSNSQTLILLDGSL
jgi:hypothetical protein